MTTLWLDLSAELQARIEAEAPHVAAYLRWEPGRHRPPRGLIWAVYQRESHEGVGTERAVKATCVELGIDRSTVFRVITEALHKRD